METKKLIEDSAFNICFGFRSWSRTRFFLDVQTGRLPKNFDGVGVSPGSWVEGSSRKGSSPEKEAATLDRDHDNAQG
jgi:hypothetical protein